MSLAEVEVAELAFDAQLDRPRRGRVWPALRSDPAAFAGFVLVGMFLVVALVGPLLAPHAPGDGDLSLIRPGFVPGPSAGHPLGLDHQGRDVLSRILHGARSSLAIAVFSVSLGTILGVAVGGLAAIAGGWVDTVLMRLVDVMLAIPGLLFAIGLAALLGPSLHSMVMAIGVTTVPIVARLLRGTMLSERERDYVLAAQAVGARSWRIARVHVLPNSMGPLLAGGTLALGGAILDAAGLAFLGLGPSDSSSAEWGRMLAESQRMIETAPQLVLFPGIAIVGSVLGFNLLGDALRDALDPKARR